jgi:serine/threonine protein kinase
MSVTMAQQSQALEDIFLAALERTSAERCAYLDKACGADAALRQRVEALLSAHEDAGSFLEKPAQPLTPLSPPTQKTVAENAQATECDAAEPSPPARTTDLFGDFGAYRITGIIGQGGMGMVFLGHEARLHRTVAIKVLNPALASIPAARERFLREARSAAAVRHEHVITIHAIDEAKGLPYLVMEHVQGESLQQRLDRAGPLPVDEVTRTAEQVAAGLSAAHAQGLIHRDIKPANILVDAASGQVKIADFGLARPAEEGGITQTSIIAGSPQYMSPEQARGERADERSDLFSLGCLLYALCVGHSPFRADSIPAALARVRNGAVEPVNRVNRATPAWLGDIIHRLLEKKPDRRLQSADAVIAALRAHAAPPAAWKRSRSRKRRWILVALSLVAAAALAGAAISYPWRRDRDDGIASNPVAPPPPSALPPKSDPPASVPKTPPDAAPAVAPGTGEIRRFTARGRLDTMALSPDQKTIYAGGTDGRVYVWDLDGAAEQRTIPIGSGVTRLRMSGDGARLAVTTPFMLWVYDPHTGDQLGKLPLSASIHDMVFLPDHKQLLCVFFGTGTKQKDRKVGAEFDYEGLNIIDTVTGKMARTLRLADPHYYRAVACSPDGKWFAAGSDDGGVFAVDVAKAKATRLFKMNMGACMAVAFSHDGQRLFASDQGNNLRGWRVSDAKIASAGTFPHRFTRFYLSPDDTWLALNNAEECDLYDLTQPVGHTVTPLPRHDSPIADVAFLSNGEQILTCSWDGTVRLWKMPSRVTLK